MKTLLTGTNDFNERRNRSRIYSESLLRSSFPIPCFFQIHFNIIILNNPGVQSGLFLSCPRINVHQFVISPTGSTCPLPSHYTAYFITILTSGEVYDFIHVSFHFYTSGNIKECGLIGFHII